MGLFRLKPPSGTVEWFTFADLCRIANVVDATMRNAIKRAKVRPVKLKETKFVYHREDAFQVLAELQKTSGRRAVLASKAQERARLKST